MNADQLRASILQKAIEGKLVPQLDSEPAVEQIGKAPEEVPFEIPEKWKWCRLVSVVENIVDCPHSTPKYCSEETEYLAIDTNCINQFGFITQWRYVTEEIHAARTSRLQPQENDIVYTREGSIGRAAIVPKKVKVCMGQRVMLIRPGQLFQPEYLQLYLMSRSVLTHLIVNQKGIGAKHINVSDVKNLPIPLLSIDEQRRIVARLKELLPLVEEYGKHQSALEKLEKEFPDKLKASILQQAIEGKLVPQLDSEPAVEQIGKAPEEVPFEIPEKWKWCKLGECVQFNPKVSAKDETTVSFLKMACVDAGYSGLHTDGEAKVWKAVKQGLSRFNDGDVLLAKITPCFQNLKSSIAKNLASGVGAGSTEFHVLRGKDEVLPEYLLWFVKSPYLIKYGVDNFKGTAGQQRIGTKDLQECAFPLPSVSEQRRIVAQIKELFEQIDNYTKSTEVR